MQRQGFLTRLRQAREHVTNFGCWKLDKKKSLIFKTGDIRAIYKQEDHIHREEADQYSVQGLLFPHFMLV